MKIVFFTQEDPFYVKIFFDEFFAHFKSIDEIKTIVISRAMGRKSLAGLAKQMYGLYGPINFLRVGFRYMYYKVMSKRGISKSLKFVARNRHKMKTAVDGNRAKTYSVKETAEACGLDVIERSDLNSESFERLIKRYDADLFISVASPIIFKEELIKIPRVDCINIHNAPLPNYRGMLPSFWQLYHGEREAGMTVHRIEIGIDTGAIITQSFVRIETEDTLDSLIRKTKKKNAEILIDVIEDYRNSRIQYKKMEGEGSYFSFPKRKDVKEFHMRGHKII